MKKPAENWIKCMSILLIIILGFMVYANFLEGKFLWDDEFLVQDNVYIKNWEKITYVFKESIGMGSGREGPCYRPLQMITYMLDYSFWRLNVFGYHLTNILLHISVALVLYWLINLLFCNRKLSLLASLLFIIHPIHTEAVSYISARADSLSALFILLSLVFYIKYINLKSSNFYLFMLVSYACALLSKEYSLILFPLLLLYFYTFEKRLKMKELLPILLITLAYVMLRMVVLSSPFVSVSVPTTFLQRLPGFFAATTEYVRLLFLPFNLHMEYGDRLFSFSQPRVIFGVMISLGLLIYAFKKRRSNPLIFFSILWFFIALLPVSNLYPINAYMAEHWLYLPSVGYFLILANGLSLLHRSNRLRLVAIGLLVGIILFYSHLTIKQNNYWKDPVTFYKETLKYAPSNQRMYNNLGVIYHIIGKSEESIASFKKVIDINPRDAGAYNNLGNLYDIQDNKKEAIAMYNKAIEINPGFTQVYYNLGQLYFNMKKIEEAIALYEKATVINPNDAEAYYRIGDIYEAIGKKEKAIEMFKMAIEKNRNYVSAYSRLAYLYESINKTEEIISLYSQAIANNLDYFDAYYNFANLYSDTGRETKAIALYKKAIRINPNSAEAYSNLGGLYCSLGKTKEAIKFLKKAIVINPALPIAHNNLAVAYFFEKKYNLAIQQCDEAIKLGYKVNSKFLELLKPRRSR